MIEALVGANLVCSCKHDQSDVCQKTARCVRHGSAALVLRSEGGVGLLLAHGDPSLPCNTLVRTGRANRHLKNSRRARDLSDGSLQRHVCYALLRKAWLRHRAASKANAKVGLSSACSSPWHDNFAALVSSIAGGRLAPRQCLKSPQKEPMGFERIDWMQRPPGKIWFESAA